LWIELNFINEDNTNFFSLITKQSFYRPGLTSFGKLSSTNIYIDLLFDITNLFNGLKHSIYVILCLTYWPTIG